MADYTVDFVGWNTDGNSDKVWGYFHLKGQPNVFYTFWGKRTSSNGPKLTFKKPDLDGWELRHESEKKERNGYEKTCLSALDKETEGGFIDPFEQRFVMTRLCDAFHPNGRQTA